VLYEMLTGTVPFTGRNALELLHRICQEEPVRLRRRKPDLDRDLEVIVMKAMDKDPARRYQTVAELGADLKRYLANDAISASPPTAVYRTRKFLRRHRFVCLSVFSTLVAVMLVAVGFVLHDLQLIRQLQTDAQQNLFNQQASVLLDPRHEAWRWFHCLRLDGRREEACKALACSVLMSNDGDATLEANRQLWLGIMAKESGDDADRYFCAAESLAEEAGRVELALAAQIYRGEKVEVPEDLPVEARAILEYHRGHAALLRGRIEEARDYWNNAVDLSMTPIESKCARAELRQLSGR